MKKKSICFSIILLVCSIIWFCICTGLNRGYISEISLESPAVIQLKQLVAMMILWAFGFVFMLGLKNTIPLRWCVFYALPMGCITWSFSSIAILMLGIPYSFGAGILGSILFTALFYGVFTFFSKSPNKSDIREMPALILLILATAVICASGIIYTFVSYDSFYYFINYGHALASVGNYRALMGDNTITLTNIGQFVPMLCSFLSFFGIDQPYGLQAFLGWNLTFMFGAGLWDLKGRESENKATGIVYTILFTVLIFTSTSYLVISSWMLANMYCMVYIFTAFLSMVLYEKGDINNRGFIVLNALCFMALTLIRKDGIIFAAFLFVCIVCRNAYVKEKAAGEEPGTGIYLFNKKALALMFLPATITEILWLVYVRLILEASVRQSSPQSIANNKNIVFILCIIAATYIYLTFGHALITTIARKIKRINEYHILLAGMVMAIILAFIIKGDMVIDNIDFTIRNMVLYPSAWGVSAVIFSILFVFSLIGGDGIDHWQFMWMGYVLLNLISYSLVDSKWLWVNWDDSYSRVLLQIVPVFVFIMALKIKGIMED